MKYIFIETEEFTEWFEEQTARSKVQIDDRLDRIRDEGYFGKMRSLGGDVYELKWDNGRRVYYAHIPINNIILLIGGNKNGQSKDIAKAKRLLGEYTQT